MGTELLLVSVVCNYIPLQNSVCMEFGHLLCLFVWIWFGLLRVFEFCYGCDDIIAGLLMEFEFC